jgi:hypothetical protein
MMNRKVGIIYFPPAFFGGGRDGSSPGMHLLSFVSRYPFQHSGTVPLRTSGIVPLCHPANIREVRGSSLPHEGDGRKHSPKHRSIMMSNASRIGCPFGYRGQVDNAVVVVATVVEDLVW